MVDESTLVTSEEVWQLHKKVVFYKSSFSILWPVVEDRAYENLSNYFYKNYNIFNSQYCNFPFYYQKIRSGKQYVILWYTFCHSVVKTMSRMVHLSGRNQEICFLSNLTIYSTLVYKNLPQIKLPH